MTALLTRLFYGAGLRLRIKDADFERHVIIAREAKEAKDRGMLLPRSLASALRLQILAARAQWEADRQVQRGGVEVPHALENKYPKVSAHAAPFVCHPFAAIGLRHSHDARATGAQRCVHHHDLHTCAQGGSRWHSQSFGCAA